MYLTECLTLIRHGESTYNRHRLIIKNSADYLEFLSGLPTQRSNRSNLDGVALKLVEMNKGFRENETIPLSNQGQKQAYVTGSKLKSLVGIPDTVYVSPYQRALETLDYLSRGWPVLKKVLAIKDERLAEQKHGQFLQYGDWKLFCYFHPEQEELRKRQGHYLYRFPQGESIAEVKDRTRLFLNEIGERETQNVLIISHEVAVLTLRANIENLSVEEAASFCCENRQINCSVSHYKNGRCDLNSLKLY